LNWNCLGVAVENVRRRCWNSQARGAKRFVSVELESSITTALGAPQQCCFRPGRHLKPVVLDAYRIQWLSIEAMDIVQMPRLRYDEFSITREDNCPTGLIFRARLGHIVSAIARYSAVPAYPTEV
jgi:hypothetical protein